MYWYNIYIFTGLNKIFFSYFSNFNRVIENIERWNKITKFSIQVNDDNENEIIYIIM